MATLQVIEDIIPPMKGFGVTLARYDWAREALRTMDFTIVTVKSGFVAELWVLAVWNIAMVGLGVLLLDVFSVYDQLESVCR